WARRAEVAHEITEAHRNSDYLSGVNLPNSVTATTDLAEAMAGAEQVYVGIPSQQLRDNLAVIEPYLPNEALIVSLMKGVERGTRRRMSEVIADELPIDPGRIAVVSGPNLALEIARQ